MEYIVLPTGAYEHKVFVGPFSRKFPKAQVGGRGRWGRGQGAWVWVGSLRSEGHRCTSGARVARAGIFQEVSRSAGRG